MVQRLQVGVAHLEGLAQQRVPGEQLGAAVGVYLDGGPCAASVPSTIVDLTGDRPLVLREGAVSTAAVAEVLELDVQELLAR